MARLRSGPCMLASCLVARDRFTVCDYCITVRRLNGDEITTTFCADLVLNHPAQLMMLALELAMEAVSRDRLEEFRQRKLLP